MLSSFLSEVAENTTLNILIVFISKHRYYFINVAGLKIRDAVDWLRAVCLGIFQNPTHSLEK